MTPERLLALKTEMPAMHPFMVMVLALLTAVALVPVSYVSYVMLASDVRPLHAPAPAAAAATPELAPQPDVALLQPPAAEPVATPRNDPQRLPATSFALALLPIRAEPEPVAPPAPAFVAADTMLYAKGNARLRAAPSRTADVLATLTADRQIRTIARSTDGAWWRVSLAGGRVGYVHQAAVSKDRQVKPKPPAASASFAASTPTRQQPAPASSPGLRSYVDQTMNWLAETAARGSAPAAVRTEN